VSTSGVASFQTQPRPGSLSFVRTQSKLNSYVRTVVNIDESAPRDIETFDEWATACGVQRSNGFQLTSEDGLDISVMTTEDLPANSPVLFVPKEMILSSIAAVTEFGRQEAAEKIITSLNAASELRHFYLMLKILVEYEKGEESPWFPWLNSLPRYFSNGASMTPFWCVHVLKDRTQSHRLRAYKSCFLEFSATNVCLR